MFARNILALVSLAVLVSACGKKDADMAPLGDAAPEFGKAAEHQSLQGFVVGTWCVIDMDGVKPKYTYVFKPDGTFTTGIKEGDWDAAGTWTAAPDQLTLNYTTMKGKPWQTFIDDYKKDEQGGGQVAVQRALYYDDLFARLNNMRGLWLDEDKKHLAFSKPMPEPPPGASEGGGEDFGSSMSDMLKSGGAQLERMGPKKD